MKKRKLGRPPGRKAPERPVVSARVPEALYREIKGAAEAGGRTIGEELVWRARQTAELLRGNLDNAMLATNWKRVPGAKYGQPNWISPDNHSLSPWDRIELDPAVAVNSGGEVEAQGSFENEVSRVSAELNSEVNKFIHRIRAIRANTQPGGDT